MIWWGGPFHHEIFQRTRRRHSFVTADTGHRANAGRGRRDPASGELQQREGPVPARRDQEVLPAGRGDEPLQAIVIVLAAQELLLELLCRGRIAHLGEEVGIEKMSRPDGLAGWLASMMVGAWASVAWSSRVGVRFSMTGRNRV